MQTAAISTTPSTKVWYFESIRNRLSAFATSDRNKAPSITRSARPVPPSSETPPTTEAAIVSSASVPPSVDWPEPMRAVKRIPAMAARLPHLREPRA